MYSSQNVCIAVEFVYTYPYLNCLIQTREEVSRTYLLGLRGQVFGVGRQRLRFGELGFGLGRWRLEFGNTGVWSWGKGGWRLGFGG